MDINAAKIELLKMVFNSNDAELLEEALRMMKEERKDFYDEFSEDEKLEIQYGIEQLDRGEKISWEDINKKFEEEGL